MEVLLQATIGRTNPFVEDIFLDRDAYTDAEWHRLLASIEKVLEDAHLEDFFFHIHLAKIRLPKQDAALARALVTNVIEGGLGDWHDEAVLAAAIQRLDAVLVPSGKYWTAPGWRSIFHDTMADFGWLLNQGREAEAEELLNRWASRR